VGWSRCFKEESGRSVKMLFLLYRSVPSICAEQASVIGNFKPAPGNRLRAFFIRLGAIGGSSMLAIHPCSTSFPTRGLGEASLLALGPAAVLLPPRATEQPAPSIFPLNWVYSTSRTSKTIAIETINGRPARNRTAGRSRLPPGGYKRHSESVVQWWQSYFLS
jgi:hypothetical protein